MECRRNEVRGDDDFSEMIDISIMSIALDLTRLIIALEIHEAAPAARGEIDAGPKDLSFRGLI